MKKKICKLLFRLGFIKMAYRISPSITGAIIGEWIVDGVQSGLEIKK